MISLRGRNLAVYLFLCAVWGSTWLFIKIGLQDLPPLRFAGYRMALACILLFPFALRQRARVPREALPRIAWNGFLQIGLSYALVFIASQWIPSSLAALLFATFPIFVGLFAHFMLEGEPLTARTLLAAGVGLAGVAVIEAPAIRETLTVRAGPLVIGGALVLCSSLISAYSNVHIKKELAEVPPVFNIWGQTLVGSAFLLLGAAIFERGIPSRWTPAMLGVLAYLAVFGTALTFAGLFWLIPRVPVAVIGTIPLVDTLIAVLLGAIVLGETLSASTLAGGVLILIGVFLSGWGRKAEPAQPQAA